MAKAVDGSRKNIAEFLSDLLLHVDYIKVICFFLMLERSNCIWNSEHRVKKKEKALFIKIASI